MGYFFNLQTQILTALLEMADVEDDAGLEELDGAVEDAEEVEEEVLTGERGQAAADMKGLGEGEGDASVIDQQAAAVLSEAHRERTREVQKRMLVRRKIAETRFDSSALLFLSPPLVFLLHVCFFSQLLLTPFSPFSVLAVSARREAKLQAIKVDDADVAKVAGCFAIEEAAARRALQENAGDVEKTLRFLLAQ
jgi:NACalpha-BTF3-like transcription factor